MKECDNSKIHINSNFILSISFLILFDTLLLRPSLHCNTTLLHFTTLHSTTLHHTTLHFTQLHFATLHHTFSWWWAHIRPKHVKIDKYTKNKFSTKLALLQDYTGMQGQQNVKRKYSTCPPVQFCTVEIQYLPASTVLHSGNTVLARQYSSAHWKYSTCPPVRFCTLEILYLPASTVLHSGNTVLARQYSSAQWKVLICTCNICYAARYQSPFVVCSKKNQAA